VPAHDFGQPQGVAPTMGLKPMTAIILALPFRTMFMGTHPL
jgi:hypothetical protein